MTSNGRGVPRGPHRPHDVLRRLSGFASRPDFRDAVEAFEGDLQVAIDQHIDYLFFSGDPPEWRRPRHPKDWQVYRDYTDPLRDELFNILLHPIGARLTRNHPSLGKSLGVVLFRHALSCTGFRDKWGIFPPHPALVFDLDREPDRWRAVFYAPAPHRIFVWPWTTENEVLTDYRRLRARDSPKANKRLPDRESLLAEFLRADEFDIRDIARALLKGPSVRLKRKTAGRLDRADQVYRDAQAAGMPPGRANAIAEKLTWKRESPEEGRVRKRLCRLEKALADRIARLSLPTRHGL
jgi:hypothetical protein